MQDKFANKTQEVYNVPSFWVVTMCLRKEVIKPTFSKSERDYM